MNTELSLTNSFTWNDTTTDGVQPLTVGCSWWYPYAPYWERYYPVYYNTLVQTTPNKLETAYKIARTLHEKKLVEVRTVKQFIELINAIMDAR